MPDWESLKKLTGSKFAQNVILVPVVGWLVVYQDAFARILSSALGVELGAKLGWEPLIFYVGLVLLGVSAFLFRVLGPEPILNHDGLQGYIEDTEAVLTRKSFARLCAKIGSEVPAEVKVPGAGIGQVLDATREQWFRLNSEAIRDVLSEHYAEQNEYGPIVRSVIAITFFLGAGLTLVPTAFTVIWVFARLSGSS